MAEIELHAVVALLRDMPEHGLVRGQVGTIVEVLGPSVAEVEFNDDAGITYALIPLQKDEIIRLHHHPLEHVA